ncbi:heme-binding domain-containing protein [Sediminibacterium goheungense]|uniref:Heme-binding protein n=1 Tax=Sediminibacterium goheungense TaxID=1086393 RepID=A0A4R6IWF4_9BACT|nr:heme-binding domain-containing protein [Sediminibacterium goheungense]TDO26707.1 heme-binding protein [Sediminibacterium goheungense]
MKILKRILLLLLIAFVAIQFVRPAKNVSTDKSKHVSTLYTVPAEVNTILTKACNDCHTNNTVYPWYASVQPVSWWLDDHIKDGKKHLNFDEYSTYSLRKQYHKMEEVIEQVKEKEMPLNSYTWVHGDAKLTEDERVALTGWAQSVIDTMKAHYPIDSLVRKKN